MSIAARQHVVLASPRLSDWAPVLDRIPDLKVLTIEGSPSDARFRRSRTLGHSSLEAALCERRRWTSADMASLAPLVASECDTSTIFFPYAASPHLTLAAL